ncbi:MAG: phage tail tape measure protein [Candidatus Eisenbacteria sp.]|nr:phage tail tape measure protein [Candidatus Eisenbacteria bacterium]
MGLTMGVTMPLIAIGTKGAKVAMDFEEQMAIMGIAARASGRPISELRDYALKMGADTVFSASEAADSMISLFKAGMSADAVMGDMTGTSGALATAMDLAAASDINLAEAADTTAIAMATFGLETDAASAIANSFVQTADASVAEVSDLTQALVNAGPVAASYGWKLEDVNIALALMSESGLKGAEAGTNLKSMMANILRPTDKVQEVIKNLGIELFDTAGELKDMPEIIGVLSKALGEGAMITEEYTDEAGNAQTRLVQMTEKMRLENIQTLAGNYGKTAMNILLREGVQGWKDMTVAVGKAATAEEVANARMDTFKGSLEALGGSIETLYIRVMQPVIDDILRPMTDALSGFIGKAAESSPEMLKWGTVAAGAAILAGPLLIVVSKIGMAMLAVGGMIKGGLAVMSGPLGIAAIAIAGFVLAYKSNFLGLRDKLEPTFTEIGRRAKLFADNTAFVWTTIKKTLEEEGPRAALEKFGELWPRIGVAAKLALGGINIDLSGVAGAFEFIKAPATEVFEKLKVGWAGMLEGMGPVIPALQRLWAVVGPILSTLADFVKDVLVGAFRLFGDVIAAVLPRVGPILVGVIDGMTASIRTLWGILTGIGDVVKLVLEGDFAGAWTTAKEVVETAVGGITEIITNYGGAILELIGSVVEGIVTWFSDMGIDLPAIVETMKGDVVRKFDEIKKGIVTPIEEGIAKVVTFFTNLPGKISDLVSKVTTATEEVVKAITAPLTGAVTAVFGIGQSIVQGLVDGINAAKSWVESAISTLAGLIPQWLKNILGIGSPSKVTQIIGVNIAKGLAKGISDEAGSPVAAMAGIIAGMEKAAGAGAFVLPSLGGGMSQAIPLTAVAPAGTIGETHLHIEISIDHLDAGSEEDVELLAWRIADIIAERGLTA